MISTPKKKAQNPAPLPDRGQNVQVFVRCRPLNSMEKNNKSYSVVELPTNKEVVVKGMPLNLYSKEFHYDRVFGPSSTQNEVYTNVVSPLIEQVIQGYNCTVFAYGQTGSGKTYTMEGGENRISKKPWDSESESGIIVQALCQIFDDLRTAHDTEFSVRVSFLELYNEEIFDLLSPTDDTSKLRLYEDATKKGSVIIQGLEEVQVRAKKEVYGLMDKGALKRKTAETLMNANSSRSHTIFTVTVHMKEASVEGEEVIRVGKLNLVDLAGSENVARSGASGGRAREAGSINTSLLTLGRVITCLVERTPHIPYRESKLTRLLQDSLGGKTKTSIIATISPAHTNIEETLSTLDYAQRAKNITNRPEVNQKLSKKAVLKEYTDEIDRLRNNLFRAREGEGVYLAQENYQEMMNQIQAQQVEIKDTIGKMRALKQEMDNKVQLFGEYEQKLKDRQAELEKEKTTLQSLEEALESAKGDLRETARERDLQSHLVHKHVETETKLGQEARKLLVYAHDTSSEVSALHDKLDRGRKVENENENLYQDFLSRFKTKIDLLSTIMQTYQDDHNSQRKQIDEGILQVSEHNNKIMVEITQMISQLNQERNISSSGITEELEKEIGENNQTLNQHHKVLNSGISELQAISHEFKDVSVENFLREILVQLEREQKSYHSMSELVSSSSQELSDTFSRTGETLTSHMLELLKEVESQVVQNSGDLEKTIEINSRTTKSLDVMKTALDTLMSTYKTHDDIVQQNMKENDDICKKIFQNSSQMSSSVSGKDKVHTEMRVKVLKEIKVESDQKLKNIRGSVSDCEQLNNEESKIQENFLEVKNKYILGTSNILEKTRNASEGSLIEIKQQNVQTAESLKKKKNVSAEKLKSNKENVENYIETSEKSREKMHKEELTRVKELGGAVEGFREKINSELKGIEEESIGFVNTEIKQNTPTGSTPVPKERTYPRTLTATSPHEKIIERFRRNETLNTAAELPLDEMDSDSVISCSTRGRSTSQASDYLPYSSLSGSLTDLASVSDTEEAERRTTGLKKPQIFFSQKD